MAPLSGLLCSLCLLSSASYASVPVAELAESPRWQALMHINRGATLRGRGRSYVTDESFFLSPDGRDDPAAELEASIAALAEADSQARCAYPARYRFIAEQFGWQDSAPFAHCEEYLSWREQIPDGPVVLIFPAAYLNSPSSMFGHTLLRIDGEEEDGVWLSQAVNFGAQVDSSDNSIFYIYRGLAGGYPGYFSIVPYLTKIQDYAHLENRDMWEYTLSLDDEERRWLVEHLWELRDIRFDYYFFDENCSFRLLELIEVARPGSRLLDDYRFAEVPVNTVRALQDAGLIEKRVYRPSKAAELDHLASQLSPAARRLARRLAADPSLADEDEFLSHPVEQQRLMAQTAYEFLRFRNRTRERDAQVARNSLAMLRLVNRLSGQVVAEAVPLSEPEPPEEGHATKMIAAAYGQREGHEFGEVQLRYTYHDLFDNSTGFLRGAQIEGINVRLRSTESAALKLERFDLVNIRSLAPRSTFVRPVSWFVHAGIERVQAGDEDDRRYGRSHFVEGGPGLSWQWGRLTPFVFATFRAENNSAYDPFVTGAAGASGGLLWHAGRGATLGVQGSGYYLNNDEYRHRASVTANLPLTRNNALRLDLERLAVRGDADTEFRVSWRYFYD
ncbi:Lnb N-terminal periplasmic domain-containing protein [Alcanivorax limicola]